MCVCVCACVCVCVCVCECASHMLCTCVHSCIHTPTLATSVLVATHVDVLGVNEITSGTELGPSLNIHHHAAYQPSSSG